MPFFSIITPTYNRAGFIGKAIQSIQAQSFSDYEHIIIDDGSVDKTGSIVSHYAASDHRIRSIKQKNQGRSVARNVGIDASNGKYICFLDSDDLWTPDHLSGIHSAILELSEPKFLHTGLIWLDNETKQETRVKYQSKNSFSSDVEYVITNQFAPDCVCIYQEVIKQNLFDPNLFINEDVELWARIAAKHEVHAVKQYSAKLLMHEGNTGSSTNDSVGPQIVAFDKILSNAEVRTKLSPSFIENKKRGLKELLIRQHLDQGNRSQLLAELVKFLFLFPRNPRNASKFVLLLYNLPGGGLLKSLVTTAKGNKG